MKPARPLAAESDRREIRPEPELIPGQLTLPGMPAQSEPAIGQPVLPGFEFPAGSGRPGASRGSRRTGRA